MKLWTLVENTTCREALTPEHGLSLYLEAGGKKILFDAGQSGAFAENAEKMGIHLSQVDVAVLSHGHYDHGGGLGRFLEINDHAPIFVTRSAFQPHFNALGKDIGLDPGLLQSGRVRFSRDGESLGEGLTLCHRREKQYPFGAFGLTVEAHGHRREEDFRHEQYLLVEEDGKRIVISGCSHVGAVNILNWFHPDVLIGGFHFMKMDPEGVELAAAGRQLGSFGATYHTGHCIGAGQYARLKEILGEKISYLSTGTVRII